MSTRGVCPTVCGKDGHKREFFYKRRREARMAKEWANKDRYHPSHGVPEPCMPLPKGKGVVHTIQHGEIGEPQVKENLLAEDHRPNQLE
jgi:hypothetical protein